MRASLALMMAMAIGSAPSFAQAKQVLPEPAAMEFDAALSAFGSLCVDTLPVPEKFVAAMNGAGFKWIKEDRSPAEIFGTGNRWWSSVGAISYVHRDESDIPLANSACHLEFKTRPGFDHGASISRMKATFGIEPGKTRRENGELQTCFSGVLADGRHARFYLTSDTDFAQGAGARLSMSMVHASKEKVGKRLIEGGALDCR